MAPVKLKYIVSFSSQDKIHKASNLLVESASTKRWLTAPQDRSGQIEAIFQLEQPCCLAFLDIGLIWCASVEVRVGKSDWPQGQSYVTLVPTQILMSPVDSRLSRNMNRTCMFSKAHFAEGVNPSNWDRIQVIGRQPWRKDVQLGLSFLCVHSNDGVSAVITSNGPTSSNTTNDRRLDKKVTVADIEKHFFGHRNKEDRSDGELKKRLQKIAATAEGCSESPDFLSRNTRMVLLANKKYSKSHQNGDSISDKHCSVTSDVQEKQSDIAAEVLSFLETLNIKKEDVESLKVSDLRHKYEKLKWRKLTVDEKQIFYTCCQDFIGHMFDDDDEASISTETTSHAAVQKMSSASRKRNNSTADCENKKSSFKALNRNGKINCSRSVENSPSEQYKLSGGFLTSGVVNIDLPSRKSFTTSPMPQKNMAYIAASKLNSDHESDTVGLNPSEHLQASIHRLVKHSPKPIVKRHAPASELKQGQTAVSNNHCDSPNVGMPTVTTPRSVLLYGRSSPPQSLTSNISESLMDTHRDFVKVRRKAISSSTKRCHGVSSATDSARQEPGPSWASDFSSVSPTKTTMGSKQRSNGMAGKRASTLLHQSEDLTPVKQRPEPLTENGDNTSPQGSPWLNAARGKGKGKGKGKGRERRGSNANVSNGSKSESMQNAEHGNAATGDTVITRGSGGKRAQGQGRNAVCRGLEKEFNSSFSDSCAAGDSPDPYSGELQIEADTAFVGCPMCQDMFPMDTIHLHAADCTGKHSASTSQGSSFVQCPLCQDMFPNELIAAHASECSL